RHPGQVDIPADPAGDPERGGHERDLTLLGSGDGVTREHAAVRQRDQERNLIAVATAVARVVRRQRVRRFASGPRSGTQLLRIVERRWVVGMALRALRKSRNVEVVPVVVAAVVVGSMALPL